MRLRSFISLLLVLVGTIAWAQDPYSQAQEAYRRGELSRAAELFAAAAQAEPNAAQRAEIRVKLAFTYFAMKSRTKAEEALSAALDDSPALELVRDFYTDDFLALFNKVKTRRAASAGQAGHGQTPARRPTPAAGSLPALRQRLAAAPDNAAVEAVLVAVQELEVTSPMAALPDLLELKAEVYERLGRTSDALELKGRIAGMRAASQTMPGGTAVPLETLLEARRMLASGRAADAVFLLRGVLAAQPSCVPAIEVLGEALAEAGRYDEAFDALRTAMMGNEKPDLLLILGEVELKRKNLAGARSAFRRLTEIDFGNDRAWAALGLLAAQSGDVPTAKDALDKALRLNGTLFEARVVRAQIALAEGQAQAAVQGLQRALHVKTDDPWALGWMGFAQLQAGNAAVAVDSLGTAVAAGQDHFTLALAEAQRRSGKVAEAISTLGHAATAEDSRAGMLMARCLLDAGRPGDAETNLRAQVAAEPNNAELRYLLGWALHANKRWSEAAAELDRASKLAGAPVQAAQGKALAEATQVAQELLESAEVPSPPPVGR